ncbi:MAG: energy-coupling factor transporter transmembrane component T [Candidatus Stygibacter australis]|nr:energy-coupling factor transporter transmembrane component T [Candidatus Stygibacter australis]MDP8323332.1 energy-coupling factor transporter transmembrane component T [Candidatus Stygibacter australis]
MIEIKKGINDLILFGLTFAYTIAVLVSPTWQLCIYWIILSLFQLVIVRRLNWKLISIFMLFLLIPGISLFITSYLHLKGNMSSYPVIFAGIELDHYRLTMSLYLAIRAAALSLVSFSFLTAIHYEKLIYSLIQNLRFPVIWGYALLVAFNSAGNIQSEFKRIQQAAVMRFSHKPLFYFYIIPLLVSATRYSQQAAMSIQSRGLNQDKSFIKSEKLRVFDLLILLINLTGIIIPLLYLIRQSS